MTRSRLLVSAALLLSLVLAVLPAQAQQTEDFSRDCFWFVAEDPNAVNIFYPDEGADYWASFIPLPPDPEVEIIFRGQFPNARYMSYHLYDPAFRPVDAIADIQIDPEEGSSNPFIAGADRTVEDRDYTVRVVLQVPPEDPAEREPNTIYSAFREAPVPGPGYIMLYRIYVPDDGRDPSGDVGLPEVSVKRGDSPELDGQAACDFLNITAPPTVNDVQNSNDLGDPPGTLGAARDVIRWNRFFNTQRIQAENNIANNPAAPARDGVPADATGGYLSNVHNAYTVALTDRTYGPVLVLENRAPSVPLTLAGAPVMGEGQLRYWSICQEERNSQRFLGCTFDEEAVLADGGSMTTVISTPEDRPANATEECGVNWIPWGAQPEGWILFRNMIPQQGFLQNVFNVAQPYTADAIVGEYLPRGNHLQTTEFEERGCPAAHVQGGFDADPTTIEAVDVLTPAIASIDVSQQRFGTNAAGRVVVASSRDFADALAGSALTLDAPLLFSGEDGLDPAVRAELDRVADATATIYLLGGTAAVPQQVQDDLSSAGYEVVRLGGANRLETAALIAAEVRALHPLPESSTVLVARAFGPADGSNPTAAWADAIAAGGLAAGYHHPIVLSDTDTLSPEAAAALEDLAPERTIVLGGTAALSDDVLAAVPSGERIGGATRYDTAAALLPEWEFGRDRYVLSDGQATDGWVPGLLAAGLSADGAAPQLYVQGASVPGSTSAAVNWCDADVLAVGAGAVAGSLGGAPRC